MTDSTPPPDLDKVRKFAEGLAKEGTYSHYTGGTRRIFIDASRRHIRLADEVERLRTVDRRRLLHVASLEDQLRGMENRDDTNIEEIDRLTRDLEAERAKSSGYDTRIERLLEDLAEAQANLEAEEQMRQRARDFATERGHVISELRRELSYADLRADGGLPEARVNWLAELESEREASRGLREKLLTAENLVDDFRDASGLQTGGEYGDPSGVTPDHVRAEIKGLREALEKIAVQKLTEEMDAAFVDYADYEGGYEALIVIARNALPPK